MKIIGIVHRHCGIATQLIAEISANEIQCFTGKSAGRLEPGDEIDVGASQRLANDVFAAQEKLDAIGKQLGALTQLLTTIPSVQDVLVKPPKKAADQDGKEGEA